MKKEIEKILYEFSKYVIQNYDAYKNAKLEKHRKFDDKALTNQKILFNDEILSLFAKLLDDQEDEIMNKLFNSFATINGISYTHTKNTVQDIIAIIKNKLRC